MTIFAKSSCYYYNYSYIDSQSERPSLRKKRKHKMKTIKSTVEEAKTLLTTRSQYARNVLDGAQNWSGSDLRGNARKYGRHYNNMRDLALDALIDAGGIVAACEHGRLRTAVDRGMDDYGNQIICTRHGMAVLITARQFRHLS